jgi:hypothetical protein
MLRERKTDALVAQDLGLIVIAPISMSSSGVGKYKNFSEFLAEPFSSFGAPPSLDYCDLVEGETPNWDCPLNDDAAASCILSMSPSPNIAGRYRSAFDEPGLLDKSLFSERDLADFDERDNLISAAVTASTQNVTWYFGPFQGRWRLIALQRLDYCPPQSMPR